MGILLARIIGTGLIFSGVIGWLFGKQIYRTVTVNSRKRRIKRA